MKQQSRFSLHLKFSPKKSPQSRYINNSQLIPIAVYACRYQLKVLFIGCLPCSQKLIMPCSFGVHVIFLLGKLHCVPCMAFVPDPAHKSPNSQFQILHGRRLTNEDNVSESLSKPNVLSSVAILQIQTNFSFSHLQVFRYVGPVYIIKDATLG